MNIRFYNAKILTLKEDESFEIINGELWVKGDTICYIGSGDEQDPAVQELGTMTWERQINVSGNLLMPGFKDCLLYTSQR